MSGITDDPNDPRLQRGPDTGPRPQNEVYLVLSEEERRKGFVRPVRRSYIHKKCGTMTTMGVEIAETYARNPKFYGYTYCVECSQHFEVGQFHWVGSEDLVGS